jgi:AhpD family alkylhydroperoxidase
MFIKKELNDLYDRFSDKVFEPGALDRKTKELIALSCSVLADCVPCIEYHHTKALEHGALPDEILEALGISMSIAAGSKRAKYGGLISQLNEKSVKVSSAR